MKVIKGEGGLGCQMGQVALYELLKKVDREVYFELSNYDIFNWHSGFEVESVFNLKLDKIGHNKILKEGRLPFLKRKFRKIIRIFNKDYLIEKSYFHNWVSKETKERQLDYFKKNIKTNIKINKVFMCIGGEINKESISYTKNAYYVGAYLSTDLFDGTQEKIREIFEFPKIKDSKNIELIEKYKDRNTVSIHVRRGDYVNSPVLGGLVDLDYYKKAVEHIKTSVTNPLFIIFSDDINWCKENLEISDEKIFVDWNKGKDSYKDMQLMSLCKHNIIPNSSFSWWGAFLNKNPDKIVISPKKWYAENSKIKNKNINFKSWVEVEN